MFIALEKLKMNNDKRVGTGVDEISQLLKNGKFVSLSRLNENFQSKLDALKVTFPSLEVKECAHGLSVELFDPESHKVSDKSESSLKNHYGDNVAWFCYEASLVDADFQHDDLIPDVLEIICDNGGSIDIEEKDARIDTLTNQRDRLVKLLEGLERVTDIWLPANGNQEYQGEAEALHAFRKEYLSALAEMPLESPETKMKIKRVKVNRSTPWRIVVFQGECIHGISIRKNCTWCDLCIPF
ncbi:TPA: hypothetical protein ACGTRQ_003526 [Vibrio parahaemolyticus]